MAPTKFEDQVAASHLIKHDGDREDVDIPVDTVALVMLDRATQWIAAYPKATNTAEHAIVACQHFAGLKYRAASF